MTLVHRAGTWIGADGGGSLPAGAPRSRTHWIRGTVMVLFAAVAMVPAVGDATAGAQTVQLSPWRFLVGGLKGGAPLSVLYTDGQGLNGQAEVYTGTLVSLGFNTNGFQLRAFGNDELSGRFTQDIHIEGESLTGVATVPNGTFVRLRNLVTNETVILKGGSFSIPTGAGLVGARHREGGPRTIRCQGRATSCTAIVPLTGGASNRKLIIELTNTHLRLVSETAIPRSSDGTYLLTDGHSLRGGSQYIVTLNAIKSNPKGSHLVLKFRLLRNVATQMPREPWRLGSNRPSGLLLQATEAAARETREGGSGQTRKALGSALRRPPRLIALKAKPVVW